MRAAAICYAVRPARRSTRRSPTRRRHARRHRIARAELRVAASRSDEVAETRERDLSFGLTLREQDVLRDLERIGADRVAVAEPHEPSARLEEARELVVGDLRRSDSG